MLSNPQQQFANKHQRGAKPWRLAVRYAVVMNAARTSKDIRRRNLHILVAQRKLAKKSLKSLAIDLDANASHINQMLSGKRAMGDSVARKFEAGLGLSEGAFDSPWPDPQGLADKPIEDEAQDEFVTVRSNVAGPDSDDVIVRFQPRVRAAAGGGYANNEEAPPLGIRFRRESLSRRNINADGAMVITVQGRSMRDALDDGDTIMFDQTKRDLIDGEIYVIEIDDETMVKRLFRRTGGKVVIHSDNSEFKPYEIEITDPSFRILGRMVWSAKWHL